MQPVSKLPRVGTTIFTVMSQMAGQHGAVNLGQGFPDFECPQGLQEALSKHVRAGHNQYAPMTGVLPLRQQIARKTLELYGATVDVESEITVTSGATEALFAAIAAVVRAGDEVIVFDPCYDSYDPAITLQGATAVHVPLDPETFAIDWDRAAAAISPRTRMIMINSPHNPSGAVLLPADLDRLAELVRGRDIYVISDEVYEHIIFDGVQHASVLRHAELRARSFVLSSFGKTFHVTGWKTGYCIAPAALSVEFRKVHQYLTFSGFTPVQFAIADFLASDPQHYHELPAFYQAKRDQFRDMLDGTRLRLLPVPGGYFQLADYSAISDLPDHEFAAWLCREHKVAAIPVSAFYETAPDSRLIRFCFAKREGTLRAAAERLVAL
jgi:methionine aminotransferase